jgi:ribosomal protein S18 acetylase RimI-like enzyme
MFTRGYQHLIQAAPRHVLHVAIRDLAPTDLPRLQRALPPEHPEAHVRRLADQRAGRVSYLIAWDGPRAVGHVLVRWGGTSNSELLWLLSPRDRPPYIEALFVREAYRSLGVGTALLGMAEDLAAARGHRKIGLAVAVENWRARALYERLGYREGAVRPFASGWTYIDEHGDEITEQEACLYLTRPLNGGLRQPDALRDGCH